MIKPLAWVWMGVVIGVSFLATPVKFTADTITRPVALDVGRVTFQALGYLEWALTLALVLLVWREFASGRRPSNRALVAVGVVALAVVLQAVWLVPALSDRVASIIAGVEPPPSQLHNIYGVTEVAKVAALGLLGLWAEPARSPRSPSSSSDGEHDDEGITAARG